MYPSEHRGQFGVGLVVDVHEAVVAVLVEVLVEAEGGVVLPHEEVVADEEGQRHDGAQEHLRGPGALGLGVEALPRAVGAGEPRIERREAPLGEQQRLAAGLFAEGAEGVGERDAAALLEDDARVEVGPGVDVHGDDVAVAAARGEDFGREVHAGEAAPEDEVVGVGLADGGAEGGEVALGDQRDEGALGRGGHLTRHRRGRRAVFDRIDRIGRISIGICGQL